MYFNILNMIVCAETVNYKKSDIHSDVRPVSDIKSGPVRWALCMG